MDGLSRLVERAKALKEVRGLEVGRDKIEISHMQFADDTLFFLQESSHVRALVRVLHEFC